MLLAVDIGNSHITLGGYEEEHLVFEARLVTETRRTADQYAVELEQIMTLYRVDPKSVDGIILCSVVPELNAPFQKALSKITQVTPLILGPGVKTGLNILIDNPAQLGGDLVAGAVSAIASYPLPCAVFDMGTATTISILDKRGNFLGCMICAGTGIMLESLTTRTALLPHVSIEAPDSIIGKNTIHSMQSGLVYGTAAMLDGIADRLESEMGEKLCLVATGGIARHIVPHCRRHFELSDHLLLNGLRLIYEKNRK